jgi:hypothetical protein
MRTDPIFISDLYLTDADYPILGSPPTLGSPSFSFWQEAEPAFEEGMFGGEMGAVAEPALPAPPRRRVRFQDGIDQPHTSQEGIALRKEQRRLEVQRLRHAELTEVWDQVMGLPLGQAERRVAQALLGAAIGLNHWPKLGSLLKWQPFQSRGCLERLRGSCEECHRELWREMESFVMMSIQGRLGGTLWRWEPSTVGPWCEVMEAWPGVDGLMGGLFEMAAELDAKRDELGSGEELFELTEALLLTISRELSGAALGQAIKTWASCPESIGCTPHPLLASTISAWQRAAATTGEYGWAEYLLDVLQGNPEDQGTIFTLVEDSLAITPVEGPLIPPGSARLPPLTGAHAVDRTEVDRAAVEVATQAFQRGRAAAEREDSFWEGLSALKERGLLSTACQALAAEEPRLLASMARLYFPPLADEHLESASQVASTLAEAFAQQQVERIQSSPLNEAQRLWLAQGFQLAAAAVGRNPAVFSPLMEFLLREQMELESLGDRKPTWQKVWDWRAELFAIDRAKNGAGAGAREQSKGELRELFAQCCALWMEPAELSPGRSRDEALRRAEFMLIVEDEGEEVAVQSTLNADPAEMGISPVSFAVSTRLGVLSRAELAALKGYVIERLRHLGKPYKLRAALSDALPLVTPRLSAQSLLFEDDEMGAESAFGGVEALRGLMQKCLLELVPRRVATSWESMAVVPGNERELQHCVETMRVAHRVFTRGLPQELHLRFARVMTHPEIAQRMGPAASSQMSLI